jgi:hypothetical protein
VTGEALGTKSGRVDAGAVRVEATAIAKKVVFDMGDPAHTKVPCIDPDATTDPRRSGKTSCSYAYSKSSAPGPGHAGDTFTITATIVWDVNYTVTGAAGGGPLPAITRTATATVRVGENQAINTH